MVVKLSKPQLRNLIHQDLTQALKVTQDPNLLEVLVVTPVPNPLAQAQDQAQKIPVLNQLDLDPAQTVDNKLKTKEDFVLLHVRPKALVHQLEADFLINYV